MGGDTGFVLNHDATLRGISSKEEIRRNTDSTTTTITTTAATATNNNHSNGCTAHVHTRDAPVHREYAVTTNVYVVLSLSVAICALVKQNRFGAVPSINGTDAVTAAT